MQIRWTTEASTDLENIAFRITEESPDAALRIVRTIFRRIEDLVTFPFRGRPGREQNTRELVLSPLPYVVVYRVRESAIEVLHIWHGAQRQ